MIELHPRILEKQGKKEFAVLPYEEFERLTQELADYHDLKELRQAKAEAEDTATISLAEAREELNI
jgi:PHD/YefM family antitoxin component YafN of YafNO toxin-antitoxin module